MFSCAIHPQYQESAINDKVFVSSIFGALREHYAYTIDTLRRGIVLDRSAISRIENQDRYVMDYEAAALAKCLGVSVAFLFGERNQ
jgi:hypothetical protein